MTPVVFCFMLLCCLPLMGFAFVPARRLSRRVPVVLPNTSSNNGSDIDFSFDFNPLDYKKNSRQGTGAFQFSGNQISLRKTRMQQVVNELLNVVGQEDETRAVLQEAAGFLLEPLEDKDAVLDPDSIYTSSMTRTERYQAYEGSMEERVASANNPAVKQVLTSLRDFVLSHREEQKETDASSL